MSLDKGVTLNFLRWEESQDMFNVAWDGEDATLLRCYQVRPNAWCLNGMIPHPKRQLAKRKRKKKKPCINNDDDGSRAFKVNVGNIPHNIVCIVKHCYES